MEGNEELKLLLKDLHCKGNLLDTIELSKRILSLCDDDQKILANILSEGCMELEELLYACFQNHIMILGNCAGHQDDRKPYIYFLYNQESDYFSNSLLNHFEDSKLQGIEGISLHGSSRNGNVMIKVQLFEDQKEGTFKLLTDLVNNQKRMITEENSILVNSIRFGQFLSRCSLDFRLGIDYDCMLLYLEPTGVYIFEKNSIEDIGNIERIASERCGYIGVFRCNKKSLTHFVDSLYTTHTIDEDIKSL